MRFKKFLKEDVISKALSIPEPEYKKQYDPDIAERYLDTLQIAIQRLREKYKDKDYDPESDVDDPKLSADEAKLKDLQDKYNKWEEVAGADDEAEGEEPADEDPTSDPGEDPGDMPEEGEEEPPPEEGEEEPPEEGEEELPPEEEPPKKKKKVEEKRKTNKLKAIFDIPGRDDPTSEDDPDPVDADGSDDLDRKYPLSPDDKRAREADKEQKEREDELKSIRKQDRKDDQMRRKRNKKMREKMLQTKEKKKQERLIKSKIKKPGE
jgi:hypothetical protein